MYIDFHNHLDFYKENEINQVYKDIKDNNIKIISCSMNEDSYKNNLKFSRECDNIISTFGIHPWKIFHQLPNLNIYDDYIKNSKIIGEVGLDFHWVEDTSTYDNQLEVFNYFVKKAKTYDKFLNIHTKGAEDIVYNILNKENMLDKSIIHWYSGDIYTLEKFIDSKSFFTISVDINSSDTTKEIAKLIPLDYLLPETDGPTALQWVNGVYGMPSEIINVYNGICKVKNIELEKYKKYVNDNFKKIIG